MKDKNELLEKENCHTHKNHKTHSCSCCHDDHDDDGCENDMSLKQLIIRFALTIVFLLLGLLLPVNFYIKYAFLVVSYLIIAYDILYRAFKNICHGEIFDENFLMSLASLIALITYGVAPDAGIDGMDAILVILLYQLGEFLQDRAVDKSKDAINSMLDLDIDEVVVIKNDKESVIKLEEVVSGDILKIKPGDKIPVDGVIVSGNSNINTASLTGESKPYEVSVNDEVLQGCINIDGLINIKALKVSSESTSAKVAKLIKDASKNKANSENFIHKFAKIYTPIVILIALAVMFVPPLFLGFAETFTTWLYKGLAIMVISCPCALVISIPLSFFEGIGRSAKNGVLLKGASYLEVLSKLDVIAFDKTGTITKGCFDVIDIQAKDIELMNLLLLNVENGSTHPIAISLINHLKDTTPFINLEGVTLKAGYGMSAMYHGKEVLVGNGKLLDKENIEYEKKDEVGTIVYVAYDRKYLGYALIADTLKDNVVEHIKELKGKHNKEIVMITGDNKKVADDIALKVGIDKVYSECLPADKTRIVTEMKKDKKIVAYCGDGINDAATLLESDCGIAVSSLSSDIAVMASDVVLINDNISLIGKTIDVAKKTMRIVKQNIIGALLIKVMIMIVEIFITLPMFVAIIADVGVCLIAICNSLRIMYGK